MNSVKLDQDFSYAIKLTRLLLIPVGLWPTRSKIYQRFVRPVAIATCLLTMLSAVIPLCLLIALPAKDSKVRLTFIGPLGFSLASLLKYAMMIYQEGQVAECFWKMSLHWQQLRDDSERRVAMSSAKTGRLMMVACAFFMCGSGIPYTAMLPLSQVFADLRSNDSLWSPTYPPCLTFSSLRPIDNMMITLDCVCGLVRYTVTCGIYSIAILIVMHISSQITITNMMLDKFGVNLDCQILGQTISQHRRLLKLASRLEDTFNKIFLLEIFGSWCIIHSYGYFLFTENRATIALLTYFLLLMSFALNISMLCYIGETLTEQFSSVEKAVYSTEWYCRLPQKETKNLIVLIMMTQRPVYLTAGKLFNLSILTLSNVIKATATYVNVLQSLIVKSI